MNNLRYLLFSLIIISNSAKTSNFNLTLDKNYLIPIMGLGVAAAIYYYWSDDLENVIYGQNQYAVPNNSENQKKNDSQYFSPSPDSPKLEEVLFKIRDHKFDIKGYFSIIYQSLLAQKASQSKRIKVLDTLCNEDNLKDFLTERYASYDYLLVFYAHKPHSDLLCPSYPNDPRAHTSLLLREIGDNDKIKRVINIDGYDSPAYVNPRSNKLINERIVVKDVTPLQKASWSNMNCVLYAFTFAEIILNLIELPGIENNRHVLTNDLPKFLENLYKGIIGVYVPSTSEGNREESKNDMAIKHHTQVRERIAQAYLQSIAPMIDK